MIPADSTERRAVAAAEFDAHEQRSDGIQLVRSLCYGMTTLRNSLFTRIHMDVEKNLGRDSMTMPISMVESEGRAKLEIEVFQTAVSALEVQQRSYARDHQWYATWLGGLRLGEHAEQEACRARLTRYLTVAEEARRLSFSRVLEAAFPEATRAPLVLYRLFPLAVGVVTAVAFQDLEGATALRKRQISWLPAIRDCQECRGRPLENGEKCSVCGNPVWSFAWLTAAD